MATYSEDGQWMWSGSEWIPAPPATGSTGPSTTNLQMQDSVIGGNLNLNPQVHHHHNEQIIQNHIINESIHPMEDVSEVVTSAFESGKRALISVGALFLIALIGYLVSNLFEPVDPNAFTYGVESSSISQDDYLGAFFVVLACLWVVDGIFIFMNAGPINTFSRIRDQYPASTTMQRGDRGKVMHDIAKYLWMLPLIIVIVLVIIGYFLLKITAEMNKHQNR